MVLRSSIVLALLQIAGAFVAPRSNLVRVSSARIVLDHDPKDPATTTCLWMSEQPTDGEGADLASEFFRALENRNISIDGDEIDIADVEDEEFSAEENEGGGGGLSDDDNAILREYDMSSESSVTDDEIYGGMQDRMYSSAGSFVALNSGADYVEEGPKTYEPPTNVPDSGLNAAEVVELVLAALRNNDVPSPNFGVEVFFGYSSPGSQVAEQVAEDGMTAAQYRRFLVTSEDSLPLLQHTHATIEKADFSPDRLKGYFTARLTNDDMDVEDVTVNFILSTSGTNDEDCWLIDSMLIRPSKLRRRRRR